MLAVPHDKAVAIATCRQPGGGGFRQIPSIRSERKNSTRKAGERYKIHKEKSGKSCSETRGNGTPSTAHDTIPPAHSVFKHEFLANE